MNKPFLALLAVAVVAAAGGYFVAMQLAPQPASAPRAAPEATLLGQRRPDFEHVDASGRAVSAAEFDGKVLLINFWASWCEPCVEEMPMLSRLQQEHRARGLRVLGIALDDPERAAAFSGEMGLSYPVLLGGTDVVLTGRRYGNASGMLPYSVLVDREGAIRWLQLGVLDEQALLERLTPLLEGR